jgi:hypothetical protein
VRVQERHVDALGVALVRALGLLGVRPDDDEVRNVLAAQLRIVETEVQDGSFQPMLSPGPNRRDDDDDDRRGSPWSDDSRRMRPPGFDGH